MNMDEGEGKRAISKKLNDRKKAVLSERLVRAVEEAESLFGSTSSNDSGHIKSSKQRRKGHFTMSRDNDRNRIYHCQRQGDSGLKRRVANMEESPIISNNISLPSPTFSDIQNDEIEINYEEKLASVLAECDDICEDMSEDVEQTVVSKWQKRVTLSEANWENSRDSLLSAVLNSMVVPENFEVLCMACGKGSAVVNCLDCTQYLCPDCDDIAHAEKPLHDRQEWLKGFYRYLKPSESVSCEIEIIAKERCCPLVCERQCKLCSGSLKKSASSDAVILVTMKGRYDLHWFKLFCEHCAVQTPVSMSNIIDTGYWPGSPCQVKYLFDQEVFRVWEAFRIRMPGSSQSAFLKTLEDISASKGRTGIINATTFSKAAAEWRYCQFELEKLQGICYMDCPACSVLQHSAHVDGNHKLYRFKNVPRGSRKSYYEDLFIKDNEDVDKQIDEVYNTGKRQIEDNRCGDSHWKAAKAVSKSKKNQDETGVEVACCRHSLAQAAVNMFRGEIYGYAHYLHTQYLLPKQVKFLWQDVICLYWPWAMSHTPPALSGALNMLPALSVMHGKSHSWNCQYTWGGRWQDGAANGPGEEAEQVNSYISRLGSTTKRMTAAGREEALTEHVLGWNKRKVCKMPKYLRIRYCKTSKALEEKQKQLEETLTQFGLQGSVEEMSKWKQDVQDFARYDDKKTEEVYGELENYFLLYHQICDAKLLKSFVEKGDRETRDLLGTVELHSTVQSKTKQLTDMEQRFNEIKRNLGSVPEEEILQRGKEKIVLNTLAKLETKAEIMYYSIQKRTRDISKVADRSKMRSSMRKKLSTEKQNLMEVVIKLNTFGDMCGRSRIDVEDVLKGNFPWSENEDGFEHVPVRTKASVVDKFVAVLRLKEELDLLVREMVNFMAYYKDCLKGLEEQRAEIRKTIDNTLDSDFIEENRNNAPSHFHTKKYNVAKDTFGSLKGKLAMCNAGMWFAKLRLQDGRQNFKHLDNPDLMYEENEEDSDSCYEAESSSEEEEDELE